MINRSLSLVSRYIMNGYGIMSMQNVCILFVIFIFFFQDNNKQVTSDVLNAYVFKYAKWIVIQLVKLYKFMILEQNAIVIVRFIYRITMIRKNVLEFLLFCPKMVQHPTVFFLKLRIIIIQIQLCLLYWKVTNSDIEIFKYLSPQYLIS